MADIVLISGSPSAPSRSAALLEYSRQHFVSQQLDAVLISVRDFPPGDLVFARYESPAFLEAKNLIAGATGIVVGTPVYKAAYAGTLKTFLDVLPQGALGGKIVLPLVTGGSPTHLLAIDYTLKPVLAALGATEVLQGVYAVDGEARLLDFGELSLHENLRARLHGALDQVASRVKQHHLAAH